MADVCQRHGVKLLTYGSLVRPIDWPASQAVFLSSLVGGAYLSSPSLLVWRLPVRQVAPCTGAQPLQRGGWPRPLNPITEEIPRHHPICVGIVVSVPTTARRPPENRRPTPCQHSQCRHTLGP